MNGAHGEQIERERAMRLTRFVVASLRFFRRAHVATILAMATVTAVVIGALVVGDSVRNSLERNALARLGPVHHALSTARFIPETYARRCEDAAKELGNALEFTPVITLRGGANHAVSERRCEGIQVVAIPENAEFLQSAIRFAEDERSVIVNQRLADEIGAVAGDDIVVRIGKPSDVSPETLLGRRDELSVSIRLTVKQIVSDGGIGSFSLAPGDVLPRNAFVPLGVMQRAISQKSQVNAVLCSTTSEPKSLNAELADADFPQVELFQRAASLRELGLGWRKSDDNRHLILEHDSLLIPPNFELAIDAALTELPAPHVKVLSYLANQIGWRKPDPRLQHLPGVAGGRSIPRSKLHSRESVPYSVVTAIDTDGQDGQIVFSPSTKSDGNDETYIASSLDVSPGIVLINEWLASEAGFRVGSVLELEYFITGQHGELETRTASLRVAGVVEMAGDAVSRDWVPEYEGVTKARKLSDWDPPFPMDIGRITPADEAYWDEYRTAPKVFLSLEDGQRLWAEAGDRFGRITSFRIAAIPGQTLDETQVRIEKELLGRLNATSAGLAFQPVRQIALAASRTPTDFGMLFLSFSFFIVAAGLILGGMVFGFSVERRARELGLLFSLGFSRSLVLQSLLGEGAIVAGAGALAGVPCGTLYALAMIYGLSTWWAGAMRADFLSLHVESTSLVVGFLAGIVMSIGAMTVTALRMACKSPHDLLRGGTGLTCVRAQGAGRGSLWVTIACAIVAFGLTVIGAATEWLPRTIAFFIGGSLILTAVLLAVRLWLRSVHPIGTSIEGLIGYSLSNARRAPSRSLLTMTMLALSTFLVVAVGAFRIDAPVGNDVRAGTGGYSIVAESAIPILHDLRTTAGRNAIGMSAKFEAMAPSFDIAPFRLQAGDDASCRGLYQSNRPRILGATNEFLMQGRFSFAASSADDSAMKKNPWWLLEHEFDDGAIPVIGDESAIRWQLKSGLGKDFTIEDGRGQPRKLRFVGLLKQSVLQSELIVSDANFVRLFPETSGYSFFLIDTHGSSASEVQGLLERELERYALDARSASDRLIEFLAVQNTYISTFQFLGGLGLILGGVGLTALMLRQAWERRGEVALMSAIGFSGRDVQSSFVIENGALLLIGVLCGALAAFLAVAPQLIQDVRSVPLLSLVITLGLVMVVGLCGLMMAVRWSLRQAPVGALRSE